MKKMNNKGFSLVELIVVIAIMAVLVGVLAPQFIKYVESSRRSTDISNAQNIQSAVLADIANGEAGFQGNTTSSFECNTAGVPSAIGEAPKVKGNKDNKDGYFYVQFNAASGVCKVFSKNGGYELTDTSGASNYKIP